MTTTGPDISVFAFLPTLDLSGATPVLKILNQSTGANLANVKYVFQILTPQGVPFHVGDFTFVAPDKTGVWTEYIIPEAVPLINHIINFGSLGFKIIGAVKDSAGTIFTHPDVFIVAGVPPNSNGSDNFAGASIYFEVKCQEAAILIQDLTPYKYMGVTGVIESKSFKLIYPDGTSTTYTSENNIMVPIVDNGNGYYIIFEAVVLFTFTNNTKIRLKYKFKQIFSVLCNADLCGVSQVLSQYEKNSDCSPQNLRDQILMLSKAVRAVIGVMQPLCKADISRILSDIFEIAGFDYAPEVVTSSVAINGGGSAGPAGPPGPPGPPGADGSDGTGTGTTIIEYDY